MKTQSAMVPLLIAVGVLALLVSACQKRSQNFERNPYTRSDKNVDDVIVGHVFNGGCFPNTNAKDYVQPTTTFGADFKITGTQTPYSDSKCTKVAGPAVSIDGDGVSTYKILDHKTPSTADIEVTTVEKGQTVVQTYHGTLLKVRKTGQDVFMSVVKPSAAIKAPAGTSPTADQPNTLSNSKHSFIVLTKIK